MTKPFASTALVLALIGGAAAAQADGLSQLTYQAGVSPSAGLSLDTLAALHFNRSSGPDNHQTVLPSGAMSMSDLDAAAAEHFTRNRSIEHAQGYQGEPRTIVVVSSRHAQLIRSARLQGAEGGSLDGVAAAKFARDCYSGENS